MYPCDILCLRFGERFGAGGCEHPREKRPRAYLVGKHQQEATFVPVITALAGNWKLGKTRPPSTFF